MTERPAIEDQLRDLGPQVLGVLVRRSGDFASAEDAAQEAVIAAATHWPVDGLPDNPRGWLIQTATRKLTDQVRSEAARRRREESAALLEPSQVDTPAADDSLVLLFMCCHPALTPAPAVALTLRAVGGLTTAEIAHAFVVPESTMAQRISRAKQALRASEAPFTRPSSDEWTQRLRFVLRILYLIFNEGYASSVGTSVHRTELSAEAIRLARMAREQLPNDGEVAGLLALMLLTDARRPARTGLAGQLVPLDEQDRTRWIRALIVEGLTLVTEAMSHGYVGEYQIQAAIAGLHDGAASAETTDWPQILALYGLLERMTGNPMVTLNRAVAAAMVHGPEAGLTILATLDAALAGSHRLDAVRAHLYQLAGDHAAATRHFRAAAAWTTNVPEKNYLTMRAARLHQT